MLRLGPDLELPDNFATEGVVAVGMRGSGKSNTLVRWAEILTATGIPWVAIDPKGDWWGVGSSADGAAPGLPVPIFGGLHATDGLPLDEKLGGRIADLLVDSNLSAVLDVSRLSIGARARFLTDFCNRLMERHQEEPHVRCVIFEEAHRYIPQQVKGDAARLKEAAAAVLLEGRAFGLGCWAATQRPARLHKDVLEEMSTVVLHRIGAAATNDLRTIAGWVKHEELSEEIVPSLTKLASGEAWVLAPQTLGVAQRARIDRRWTFDSGSTPLVGAGSRPSLTLADVDTAAVKEALEDAIAKARENDPADLKRRALLAESLAEQRARQLEAAAAENEELRSWLAASEAAAGEMAPQPFVPLELLDLRDSMLEHARAMVDDLGRISEAVDAALMASETPPPPPPPKPAPAPAPKPQAAAPKPQSTVGWKPNPTSAEGRILAVLAAHGPRTRRQLCFQASIPAGTSTLRNALATLRNEGLVKPGRGAELIEATPEGIARADVGSLPSGEALIDYWREFFGSGNAERRCLDALLDAWPEELSPEQLSETTGIELGKSTMRNALAPLRKVGIVTPRALRVMDDFMEAAGRG